MNHEPWTMNHEPWTWTPTPPPPTTTTTHRVLVSFSSEYKSIREQAHVLFSLLTYSWPSFFLGERGERKGGGDVWPKSSKKPCFLVQKHIKRTVTWPISWFGQCGAEGGGGKGTLIHGWCTVFCDTYAKLVLITNTTEHRNHKHYLFVKYPYVCMYVCK